MATTERTAAERPDAPAAGPAHLAQAIADRCRRLPEAPMVGGQERLRWQHLNGAQFLRRMHSLAEDLQARGVGRGDRVVLWVPNGWRTPVLFAAVWQLGAAVVPFDREMHVEAARTILRLVEPRLVITGYGQRPAWAPEPGDDPVVEEWWEPGTRAPEPVATAAIGAGDVAAIYFTSGTTGNPKGCTISHGNLLSQVAVMPSVVPVEPGDVFGSILPLSHLFELTCGMIYPLIRGACIEYIPSRKGPDIVRVLAEQHVSHMVAVPQVLALMGAAAEERLSKLLGRGRYEALLRLADRLPMRWRRVLFYPIHRRLGGRLAMIASGGAALDPAVQLLWERMGVRTIQGYGASECSPIIAAGRADGSTPYGTVGTPLPGVEVRLDAEGQLLARGPNVMRGYWKDPARTAQVLSSDGYYATGDICELDARGNIRIMGRAQELLVLPSGMNVWPEDVEEALRKQPGIKDAVAILAPNSAGGATLHAYLIPGGTPDDALLARSVAAANGTLAAHQRLATASWWPEEDFPRTNTLKVKRRLIPTPDALPGAQAAQGAAPVDVTASSDDPVLRAVRAVTNISAVRDEQTLAELGLDSLGTTGLTVELEATTGLTLPDGEVDPGMTVAALRRAVSALATGATSSADGGTTGEAGSKRLDEARTWQPPLWFYTRGRALRRLASPFNWLHRRAVQRVISLGAEHLGALEGGIILAGTHRSYADVNSITRAIAEARGQQEAGRIAIAASAVILGRAGILGKFAISAFGLYPLRQYAGYEESLRRLVQVADAGCPILIFPQGHHTDPALERAGDPAAGFKPGVGRLAADMELPVLPFGLAGTERVVPARAPEGFTGLVIAGIPVKITPRPVAIAFGPPVRIEPGENAAAFAARLQALCFALSRQAETALEGDHHGR